MLEQQRRVELDIDVQPPARLAPCQHAERGLLDCDEQMALLVQRVSGELCGSLFFPHLAGVGLSFNPFVWSQEIDPEAGMLRLVFGLGTRAVDRNEDDYTRLVALNAPRRRPDSRAEDARAFTQRRVDAIDLAANAFVTRKFEEVAPLLPQHLLDLFTAGAESRRHQLPLQGLDAVDEARQCGPHGVEGEGLVALCRIEDDGLDGVLRLDGTFPRQEAVVLAR